MSTQIRSGSSIETVDEMVDATCAAVESDPATAQVAPTWKSLREAADKLTAEGRTLEREAARARVRLNVQDSAWDNVVAAFARAVLDASGGRRDQAPYTRFFAKTTPSAVQGFGIAREIELGRAWQAELGRSPDEPLAQSWVPKLKAATDALDLACKQRNDAVAAVAPHHTSVALFIDDVNREIDRLEGDLKKLFPGEPAHVASYLTATRPRRRTVLDDPAPEPAPAPAPAATTM